MPNFQVWYLPLFAYSQKRGSLAVEGQKAAELIVLLRAWFNKPNVPIHRDYWHYYVNAYVYGGYPVEALAKSVVFGGKTVHPTIPWSAWKNSKDYKEYINKEKGER